MALFQHQELNKRLIAQMNEPVSERKMVLVGKNSDHSFGFHNLTSFHIFKK